jgi:DNA-binding LytR/AlgR family response regulator
MGSEGEAQEMAGGDFVRVAVCDDEIRCIDDIKAILLELRNRSEELSEVSFAIDGITSGTELIAAYRRGKYDVIFLDIIMEEIDGVELARQIRRIDWDVKIVFVTNIGARMPDGYEVMAADYIVKPVSAERIEKLMRKLLLIERRRRDICEVRLKGGTNGILHLSDICYFESCLHYMRATAASGQFEFKSTMADVLGMVDGKGFVRTHRSFLVNADYIWLLTWNDARLITGAKIPVGGKYAAAAMAAYKKHDGGAAFERVLDGH